MPVRATLWDFGGVILESPFTAFSRYERAHDLPDGFLRGLNSTNPDTNAWARMERSEITMEEFALHYEAEAEEAGAQIDAREVLSLLSGTVRPEMVEAVRRCAARLPTGMITNNYVGFAGAERTARDDIAEILELFDVVIESSKVGVRKPDQRIYHLACEALGADPTETVFLDDLGINLKPARAMGMRTIKVDDPAVALAELEEAVGFPLRSVSG